MKTLITWNAGSSSLKAALLRWSDGGRIAEVQVERIGLPGSIVSGRHFRTSFRRRVPVGSHSAAVRHVAESFSAFGYALNAIGAAAHRIVFGGDLHRPVRLHPSVLRRLAASARRAPLHLPAELEVIRSAKRRMPSAVQIGCFDTTIFSDLPPESALYPIDANVSKRYGFRRYGYHGLSHAAALARAADALQKPVSHISCLTVHLGSGCSIAAFKNGRAADTSMGLTPLEGLMMGTRPGDLDPGLLLELWRSGWSRRRVEELLERRSGLLGVSRYSSDLRDILTAAGVLVRGYQPSVKPGPAQRQASKLALSMFVYRVRKYLGAYAAVLPQIEAVVFTGSAGQRNASLRRMILSGLRLPGRPKIIVAAPDEEGQMWREARALMR